MRHALVEDTYNNLNPDQARTWKQWNKDMWEAVATIRQKVPDFYDNDGTTMSEDRRVLIAANFLSAQSPEEVALPHADLEPHQTREDPPHQQDILSNLQYQLWLTIFIYPLGPAFGDNLCPSAEMVERKLDSVQSGLYSKLQDCYSPFASHFQEAEQTGNLINEAAFWLAWMRSLRRHIFRVREQTTIRSIPSDSASLETWRIQRAANILLWNLGRCGAVDRAVAEIATAAPSPGKLSPVDTPCTETCSCHLAISHELLTVLQESCFLVKLLNCLPPLKVSEKTEREKANIAASPRSLAHATTEDEDGIPPKRLNVNLPRSCDSSSYLPTTSETMLQQVQKTESKGLLSCCVKLISLLARAGGKEFQEHCQITATDAEAGNDFAQVVANATNLKSITIPPEATEISLRYKSFLSGLRLAVTLSALDTHKQSADLAMSTSALDRIEPGLGKELDEWYHTFKNRFPKTEYDSLLPAQVLAWKQWVEEMRRTVQSIRKWAPLNAELEEFMVWPDHKSAKDQQICAAARFVLAHDFATKEQPPGTDPSGSNTEERAEG
ncbi:hypothetical protein RHOSPDRAFT_27864, partial [Rhodotorula sp. JG-1b]